MFNRSGGRSATPTFATFVLVTALIGAAPAHADYRYRLHQYPGAAPTLFLGFNARGKVAGFTFSGISFSYGVKADLFTPVANLPGYAEADVWNLNDAGTMVGGIWAPDYSTETAFIRDADGNYALLAVPGWANSEAQGINDSGIVVGQAYNADSTQYIGFIYDPAHKHYTLLMPASYTLVHGINARGEIIGLSILAAGWAYPGAPAGTYGWYRATNGTLTLFRGNGIDTYARAISDQGLIGGFLEDSTGQDTGFVTDFHPASGKRGSRMFVALNVGPRNLLKIPGTLDSYVEAITPEGDVAGAVIDNASAIQGFIATRE